MKGLLLLFAISFQSDELQHTVASKVLDAVVVEVEAVQSHVIADPTIQMLEMKVESVGLGAEALRGKSIQAKYRVGVARSGPFMGFEPRSGEPIPKGKKMVVYIGSIGICREPRIVDAWADGEKRTIEDGVELIAKLKDVNEAKTEEELTDRIFYTLLKKNEASEFVWRHMSLGLRFSRKETLMSLLNRVAECAELPEERRNLIKDTLKRNHPDWAASDELRHEMILRITSSDQRKKIVPATISFANAIQNQKEAKVAENWCDNLCGVALEMEQRSKEEWAAFIEAIQGVVNTGFWAEPFNNHRHLLWKTAFRMEAESKQEAVKSAWQDMLVEQTSNAALFVKEDVLSGIEGIKDPIFRERLKEAAYTPSPKYKKAPKRPE
jgi:hypothetical protein